MPRVLSLLLLPLLFLTACSGEGPHLPRPNLSPVRATLPQPTANPASDATTPPSAQVELLALNDTDAPLWLRRLDITLTAQGADIATGFWDGSRLIDPGATVLLDISLPLIDGAPLPTSDAPADITIRTRYARSGILGLLGGETHTYELSIPLRIPQ